MTEYRELPTRAGGSTSNGVSPGRGKLKLRLSLKDGSKGLVLTLANTFYLPNSPCNLVSLGRLNNSGIFHNNKDKTLYHVKSRRVLAQAPQWNNSYLLRPLNLSDSAIHLTRVAEDTYEWPQGVFKTSNSNKPLSLTMWHKRLGHLNISSVKQHLNRLDIKYVDDYRDFEFCDSCQRAKAIKTYNQSPQKRAKRAYQYIHTDLVGPINPIGFRGEHYFFTFTNHFLRYIETYTGSNKSDWFKCLKAFHSLCKNRSKERRPVERLRSDYSSELQSKGVDEWLTKEGITFEPSAPYSQEQNGVCERVGRTIMDMTRATILEGNINDELWPEIILAMTYVKNVRPTKALQGSNPYQAQHQKSPDISHLRILCSTVYVFIHEEERNLKSEKWAPRATHGILVGYDGHTIYQVHVKCPNKVIRVKDLQVFEDNKAKASTDLPDYEDTPTFQGFLLADDNDKRSSDPESPISNPRQAEAPAPTSRSGRTVKPTAKAKEAVSTSAHRLSRKVKDAERAERLLHAGQKAKNTQDAGNAKDVENPRVGQKVIDTEPSHVGLKATDVNNTSRAGQKAEDANEETRTCAGQRAKDAENSAAATVNLRAGRKVNDAETAKRLAPNKTLPIPQQSLEVESLIAQLAQLLELDWSLNESTNILTTQEEHSKPDNASADEDPVKILATRIHDANAIDQSHFACVSQFDVEEPETYAKAMQGPNAPQWAQAMTEELDQLHKNNTWKLVHKDEIEPGHCPLGGKWVYKVKRDVNGNIARFKARWVVKKYLQQFGIDFDQTFAAVVKPMAFRVLFAIAAFYDLDIDQMDVKKAFLYGLIDQLIYVEVRKSMKTEANRNMVCKLLKALYGLKQSPRLWYKKLSAFLLKRFGLRRINADHSIFTTDAGFNGPIVSTFVDNSKIMGIKGSGFITKVKEKLAAAFSMVDMGPISFYLGLKVQQDREKKTIKLSQPAYIDKVMEKFHLNKANVVNTTMKETEPLTAQTNGKASPSEKETYQRMTGSLVFSMVETRPDIAFSTSVVSRFAKNPSRQHTEVLKTILRYLKGSRNRGITYGGQDKLLIERYSDSDWAGDKESRKSTSGYIFMLNGGQMSWCSKRQSTVALSSTEAEYIALTLAAKEATWLWLLLTELGLLQPDSQHALIKLSEHNTCAQAINQDLDNPCRRGGRKRTSTKHYHPAEG